MTPEELNPYYREIAPGVMVDVYDVLDAFGVTNPAIAHAAKKLLLAGVRTGGKPPAKDYGEAIKAIQRGMELDAKAIARDTPPG